MEVIVQKSFRDRFDQNTIYQPGEVVKFEAERALDLVERELAIPLPKPGDNFKDGPVGAEGEPGLVGELVDDANGDDTKGDKAEGDDAKGEKVKEDKPSKGEVKQEQTADKPKTKKGK